MTHLLPECVQVESIVHDTHDVFTIYTKKSEGYVYKPGQFNMIYHFGFGEIALSIAGDPDDKRIAHTIRAVGPASKSLQQVKPGEELGLRGPFGSHWPLEKKGCDVLLIGGGVGVTALHSVLHTLMKRKSEYGNITLLYGTKTFDDLLYTEDFERMGANVVTTLDTADSRWKGNVGVVTPLIPKYLRDPKNTLVMMCGPEIMMHYAIKELTGVDEENIYVSMERNMQCAVGFCGHCQYGPYFVCKEGPIFTYPQIKRFFNIREV